MLKTMSEIRKYTNSKIIIISHTNNNKLNELNNLEIIENKYLFYNPLISYYYFYKNNFFNKALIIDDHFNLNLLKDIIENINNLDYLNIIKKNNKNIIDEEYNIFYKFINNSNLNSELKNKIINKYKNKKNKIGCCKLYSICKFNLIKNIQDNLNIFYFLKCLDYNNLNYLENIFGFLLDEKIF